VSEGQEVKVKVLEIDPRGKVRLSMRVVDQETGAELEDTRPPREAGADRPPRSDRGPRREGGGGDRDRGPRREGGGPRRDGAPREGGDRGPRRERSEGGNSDGPAPEFAPAFLSRDDD
jgi:polyribonucleotide nucleotidyltransferase